MAAMPFTVEQMALNPVALLTIPAMMTWIKKAGASWMAACDQVTNKARNFRHFSWKYSGGHGEVERFSPDVPAGRNVSCFG